VANYGAIYAAAARRAVREGVTDAEAFIERAAATGMPLDVIERKMLEDLTTGGPIFGKFVRSLEGAAGSAALAAVSQGEAAALAYAEELISLAEMDDILESADAEELDALGKQLDPAESLIWVATLKNTCHRCLPLHGKIASRQWWEEQGLSPESIHDGWASPCYCNLIPVGELDAMEETAPLVRERVESATGLRGSKRTQRAVAQRDIERARAAVEKAMDSEEGRRTLRLMGQVNG